MQIHPRLPIIEPRALDDPRDQVIDLNPQVKDRIGLQSEAVDILDPLRVGAAHDGPGHEGIDVPICENDKSRPKRGDHLVLQSIREVGRIKEAHGDATQGMAFLGLAQPLTGQGRAGHAGIQHRVAGIF